MIGEVSDLAFIGSQQAFMLSSDGLLSLFDNQYQSVAWRK
jgi:hypothetical protein